MGWVWVYVGEGDEKGDGWIKGRVVDFVMLGERERERELGVL